MHNSAQILGNVGQNPEIRMTPTGKKLATFSVATKDRYKSGEEWKDVTDWHNVQVWGRQAEVVEKYVGKGTKICIVGMMKTDRWNGNDGLKHHKTYIRAQKVMLLGNCKKPADDQPMPNYEDFGDLPADEDLPF